MTDARNTPVFTIQRRFAAPIERVFDTWADPVQMEQWSGPAGSQVTVLSGEVAPGQTLHSHFRAADGAEMHNLVRYREVVRRTGWSMTRASPMPMPISSRRRSSMPGRT